MGGQKHSWTTFYNPRNGRVRIQACAKCGIAKGLESPRLKCEQVSHNANKMIQAGWQPLSVYS